MRGLLAASLILGVLLIGVVSLAGLLDSGNNASSAADSSAPSDAAAAAAASDAAAAASSAAAAASAAASSAMAASQAPATPSPAEPTPAPAAPAQTTDDTDARAGQPAVETRTVRFVNSTDVAVEAVHARAQGDSSYGPDLLGESTISAGQHFDVVFPAPNGMCNYHIYVEFDNKAVLEQDLNICSANSLNLQFQRYLTVINRSQKDINGVYVVQVGGKNWSNNTLESGSTLSSGSQMSVTITEGSGSCDFFVRVTYTDGSSQYIRMNACRAGAEATFRGG